MGFWVRYGVGVWIHSVATRKQPLGLLRRRPPCRWLRYAVYLPPSWCLGLTTAAQWLALFAGSCTPLEGLDKDEARKGR